MVWVRYGKEGKYLAAVVFDLDEVPSEFRAELKKQLTKMSKGKTENYRIVKSYYDDAYTTTHKNKLKVFAPGGKITLADKKRGKEDPKGYELALKDFNENKQEDDDILPLDEEKDENNNEDKDNEIKDDAKKSRKDDDILQDDDIIKADLPMDDAKKSKKDGDIILDDDIIKADLPMDDAKKSIKDDDILQDDDIIKADLPMDDLPMS